MVTYHTEGLGNVGFLHLERIPLAHDKPVQVGRRSSHFNLKVMWELYFTRVLNLNLCNLKFRLQLI